MTINGLTPEISSTRSRAASVSRIIGQLQDPKVEAEAVAAEEHTDKEQEEARKAAEERDEEEERLKQAAQADTSNQAVSAMQVSIIHTSAGIAMVLLKESHHAILSFTLAKHCEI